MNDYIRKQDAIKVLTQKEREKFNDWERSGDELSLYAKKIYSNSILVIYDLPPADAVEVVRCVECRHYEKSGWCKLNDVVMQSKDFCSYGERKDG